MASKQFSIISQKWDLCVQVFTSAVMVAFGAKPCPGLIDSICCPAGNLERGSKAMDAWPGRNSIRQRDNINDFPLGLIQFFCILNVQTTARIFNIRKRLQQKHFIQHKMLPKAITASLPAVHFLALVILLKQSKHSCWSGFWTAANS